jgi:hypothetical protein
MNKLHELLLSFVAGADRSIAAAQEIETEIVRQNLDDSPDFESLVSIIASYRPGGGEYLYDEQKLVEVCGHLLHSQKWC